MYSKCNVILQELWYESVQTVGICLYFILNIMKIVKFVNIVIFVRFVHFWLILGHS